MGDTPPRIEMDEKSHVIQIAGALDLAHYRQAEDGLQKVYSSGRATSIDLSEVTKLDTAGALLLKRAHDRRHVTLENINEAYKALLKMVDDAKLEKPVKEKRAMPGVQTIIKMGNAGIAIWQATIEFIQFLGTACVELGKTVRHPSRLRLTSVIHHIEAIGIDAIPIISLIAFVISIVIAYQGLVQLKPLGAERYTVNLIAISVLREMGVLLTAIMVAGRSGSAFTAEIGVMQVREEVDALKTFGFDPFELLVLPRIIALLIALPLLAFLADVMGLFGGAVISLSLLDIPLPQYLEQVREVVTWKDFFVGMIKAPVFALAIALVGCLHGLKVSGSSESVGKETTKSVVEAIFLVLMIDGVFSIYFQKVGL